jgi:hypothetical protein
MSGIRKRIMLRQRSGLHDMLAGCEMPPEIMIINAGLKERKEKEYKEEKYRQHSCYRIEPYGIGLHWLSHGVVLTDALF